MPGRPHSRPGRSFCISAQASPAVRWRFDQATSINGGARQTHSSAYGPCGRSHAQRCSSLDFPPLPGLCVTRASFIFPGKAKLPQLLVCSCETHAEGQKRLVRVEGCSHLLRHAKFALQGLKLPALLCLIMLALQLCSCGFVRLQTGDARGCLRDTVRRAAATSQSQMQRQVLGLLTCSI